MNGVAQLQRMLRRLSRLSPGAPSPAMDGVFGERTLEAVMIFQRDHGLPVTGVVDRATWEAMAALCRASIPPNQ